MRGHNVIKNFVGLGMQKAVRITEQVILIPFILRHWGAEYYGAWITITTIPTAFSLSDLGLSTAAGNLIVLRYANKDYAGAARAAVAGRNLISIAIVATLFISAILFFSLKNITWIKKLPLPQADIFGILILLIISRMIYFYCQLYDAYFRAGNKASLGINLFTGYSLTRISAQIAIIISGFHGLAIAFSELVVVIIFVFIFRKLARNNLPKLLKNECDSKWSQEVPELLKKGLGFMGTPAWQALYFQGTTVVVWKILGVEAVAVFNTMRTLSRSVNQVYCMIENAVYPEMQLKIGLNNLDAARQMFRVSLAIAFLTGIVGGLLLYAGGPTIYKFWTGGSLTAPNSVWLVFIIGIMLNAIWWTASTVFRAANIPGRFAAVGIFGAFGSIAAAYFLGLKFGLIGVVIGSIVMELVMFFWTIPQSCKILRQSLINLFKDLCGDMKTGKQIYSSFMQRHSRSHE